MLLPARGAVSTVGDLLDRWNDAQVDRHAAGEISERTRRIYRTQVGHWRGAIGNVPLRELTRALVADTILRWRADEVMSPRQARLVADVLTSAVKWGVERKHIAEVNLSGVAGVVDDDEHEYNARTPTRAEVARVLEVMPAGRERELIEILSITGARVGEAGALTVDSYDAERRDLAKPGVGPTPRSGVTYQRTPETWNGRSQ